jgi:hypothetical protein
MKIKLNKNFYLVYIMSAVFFWSVCTPFVYASEYYFGTQSLNSGKGSTFPVGVFLDTKGVEINAVDGKIKYSKDILEFKEIILGDSIISFWIKEPELVCDTECYIEFSGITPGGFVHNKAHIFSIVFEAKEYGEALLDFEEGKALLNDGLGSESELKYSPLAIEISEDSEISSFEPPYDNEPPESFVPYLDRDENLFENKYFVAFSAKDKLSGVSYYEVAESVELYNNYEDLNWKKAKSPYILEDQELNNYVYIKATDKQGNIRVQVIEPKPKEDLLQRYLNYGIILLTAFITCILLVYIWRRKKKTH